MSHASEQRVAPMAMTTVEPFTTEPLGSASESFAQTYRAAVVHDFHEPLTVEQVAAVKLQAGQVRVKVEATGLCHTDIHAAHGDWPVKPSPPFIPGHEGVGLSLIHISEPTRRTPISYAVFCL